MPIFKIDAAALYIAHTFLDAKCSCNETSHVFIEKSGANNVRLSALDGHKLISFFLRDANPSGLDFDQFGLRIDSAALKTLKPKKDTIAFVDLAADDCGVEVEANGMTIKTEMTLKPCNISQFWERVRKCAEKDSDFRPSVIPMKAMKAYDFSGFFSASTYPAFIKVKSMTVVNIQGLPQHMEARGIVMQMKEALEPYAYFETFGEDVPDWC